MDAKGRATALELFQPAVREWFARSFEAPTPAQALAWPAIRARREHAAPRADRQRQDARRVPLLPRPARCSRRSRRGGSGCASSTSRRSRRSRWTSSGTCARRSPGSRRSRPAAATPTGSRRSRCAAATRRRPERARFARDPADILITTPESLYLLLTSNAREVLRSVETVIVDEIHALVPTKRGAHLALSLERLEALAGRAAPAHRPLRDAAAARRGGAVPRRGDAQPPSRCTAGASGSASRSSTRARRSRSSSASRCRSRTCRGSASRSSSRAARRSQAPVARVDLDGDPPAPARARPRAPHDARLREQPAHRRAARGGAERARGRDARAGPPRLDRAPAARRDRGRPQGRAAARPRRDVARSSSASTWARSTSSSRSRRRRRSRAGCSGSAAPGTASARRAAASSSRSTAPISLACAGAHRGDARRARSRRRATRATRSTCSPSRSSRWCRSRTGTSTRSSRRVRARGAVRRALAPGLRGRARHALRPLPVRRVRRPAPAHHLGPRRGRLRAREGARRVAVVNGGTIPDRGLYGVFLAGGEARARRASASSTRRWSSSRASGETFLLGASTWRIEEITHDRVLVSPAPGEPGKMPFWKGDAAGRPLELGRRIGAARRASCATMPRDGRARAARARATTSTRGAAENLLRYLEDQAAGDRRGPGRPDHRRRALPRRARRLARLRALAVRRPGARAVGDGGDRARARGGSARTSRRSGRTTASRVRLPGERGAARRRVPLPGPGGGRGRSSSAQLGATALFAAKFREAAGARAAPAAAPPRAAHAALAAAQARRGPARGRRRASRRFPIAPRDLPRVPARRLRPARRSSSCSATCARGASGSSPPTRARRRRSRPRSCSASSRTSSTTATRRSPSAARRRSPSTRRSCASCSARPSCASCSTPTRWPRSRRSSSTSRRRSRARSADGVADLLLRLGDLSREELARRAAPRPRSPRASTRLVAERRAVALRIAGEERFVAVEDAARYRDALGVPLPPGLPEALLGPVPDALEGLVARYARRHAPFTDRRARGALRPRARRGGGARSRALVERGRLLEGAFRPHGAEREWCDPEVLRGAAPPLARAAARGGRAGRAARSSRGCCSAWHGIAAPGPRASTRCSTRSRSSRARRSRRRSSRPRSCRRAWRATCRGDLDALAAAGEVLWVGPRAARRARRAHRALPRRRASRGSCPPARAASARTPRAARRARARSRSSTSPRAARRSSRELHAAAGGGYEQQTVDALWTLVWRGLVTNDTFQALRAYARAGAGARRERRPRARAARPRFRSRLAAPPAAGGRWTLVEARRELGGRARRRRPSGAPRPRSSSSCATAS